MKGSINIDFLQDGGVPLTNDLMKDIMEAFAIFNYFGEIAGNLSIISGCQIQGNYVNDGIVYIDGDLLPFKGGVLSNKVIIEETKIEKTFENLENKALIYKKIAKFGNANITYNWADFKTLKTLQQISVELDEKASKSDLDALELRLQKVELKTAPIENGTIVLPFRRPVNEIPQGWKECLDTRGKILIHCDPNDVDLNTLGKNVGSKTKTLSVNNLPSFQYSDTRFQEISNDWRGGGNSSPGNGTGGNSTDTRTFNGQNLPFDVLNPGRIVLFIEPNFQ